MYLFIHLLLRHSVKGDVKLGFHALHCGKDLTELFEKYTTTTFFHRNTVENDSGTEGLDSFSMTSNTKYVKTMLSMKNMRIPDVYHNLSELAHLH